MPANFSQVADFIWGTADLLRDHFKRGKYQDVILPFTVLRRIDLVLDPTKHEVLRLHASIKDRIENLDPPLNEAAGFAFHNRSNYDFGRLVKDHRHLADNLGDYIQGFSQNMREVLEKFEFPRTIQRLDESGLLFPVMERFTSNRAALHPDQLSNHEMGLVFEELIRKFNEALDENPGEHFTPREVVRLMVDLLTEDTPRAHEPGAMLTICDPCCGTGGMLTATKDRILERNGSAVVHLYGQEVNPETYAVCKADLFVKSKDGRDAENVKFGSTLRGDDHDGRSFDFLIANPPYGKDWKQDQTEVTAEAARGDNGRFPAGLPRKSDGQLLFLQHMLSRMNDPENGGSRVAIVMNGSPLFSGDAGGGESEIRRWILENDWLETIVALPEQLFYNTGIATYVWVLTNRKDAARRGKVQLIDARDMWQPMRKSLGDKRREIGDDHIREIVDMRCRFEEEERSKLFATTAFGYRKITVERPLRLNFHASDERVARLEDESAFAKLSEPKKRKGKAADGQTPAEDPKVAEGKRLQRQVRDTLASLPDTLYRDREEFLLVLNAAARERGLKLSAALRKAVLSALSERDDEAKVCRDAKSQPEPDTEMRDTESVPLAESIEAFFDREVTPHVPDAWINDGVRDEKDGEIGRVGYEINFNRYFYTYVPPRLLADIEADVRAIEDEIGSLLDRVVGPTQ
jgi:type I restriction enzyme M protein